MAINQMGMELFSQQDLKGLVSHYTSDGTLMFPGMDTIQGKDGVCVCVWAGGRGVGRCVFVCVCTCAFTQLA